MYTVVSKYQIKGSSWNPFRQSGMWLFGGIWPSYRWQYGTTMSLPAIWFHKPSVCNIKKWPSLQILFYFLLLFPFLLRKRKFPPPQRSSGYFFVIYQTLTAVFIGQPYKQNQELRSWNETDGFVAQLSRMSFSILTCLLPQSSVALFMWVYVVNVLRVFM